MTEVRVSMTVEGSDVSLRIDRIDREAKRYEQLTKEGTWRQVSLYEASADDKFIISGELISQLARELKELSA